MEISLDKNRASHYERAAVSPAWGSKILNWLMRGTHDEPHIDKIFVELCSRLRVAGVPVARASLHLRTHHPQWLGARIIWRSGMRNAEIQTVGYHVEATAEFLKSPLRAIIEGANEISSGYKVAKWKS